MPLSIAPSVRRTNWEDVAVKKKFHVFSQEIIFLFLMNSCFCMFVVIPRQNWVLSCEGQNKKQTCLGFGYSDSKVATPSLWCVSNVPQDIGQRSVNSTIQKGKWDGMCYSYTLSVTKYSTTLFPYLLVRLGNKFGIYLPPNLIKHTYIQQNVGRPHNISSHNISLIKLTLYFSVSQR